MKTLEISDEIYESLKAFVVDPFDDTPNAVLMRVINIANKAQSRWSPFANCQQPNGPDDSVMPRRRILNTEDDDKSLML